MGDPEQLKAIEAEAAFRALAERHGAAEISAVPAAGGVAAGGDEGAGDRSHGGGRWAHGVIDRTDWPDMACSSRCARAQRDRQATSDHVTEDVFGLTVSVSSRRIVLNDEAPVRQWSISSLLAWSRHPWI